MCAKRRLERFLKLKKSGEDPKGPRQDIPWDSVRYSPRALLYSKSQHLTILSNPTEKRYGLRSLSSTPLGGIGGAEMGAQRV